MAKMERRKLDGLTFEKLYEEFENYNRIKNLRPATLKSYRENLQSLKTFMDETGLDSITNFTSKSMGNFIQYLQAKGSINSITINTYLRATRVFLRYAMTQGYLNEFKINLISQDKAVKEIYSEEEIEKLIKKPDLKNCSFSEFRKELIDNIIDEYDKEHYEVEIDNSDVYIENIE